KAAPTPASRRMRLSTGMIRVRCSDGGTKRHRTGRQTLADAPLTSIGPPLICLGAWRPERSPYSVGVGAFVALSEQAILGGAPVPRPVTGHLPLQQGSF